MSNPQLSTDTEKKAHSFRWHQHKSIDERQLNKYFMFIGSEN